MDKASQEIADWLREEPRGVELTWYSDHLSVEEPWAFGWVDVLSDDIDPPGYDWLWTITWDEAEGDQAGTEWSFQWPPDLIVHRVWDPALPPPEREVLSIPVEHGLAMSEDQAAEVQAALDGSSPAAGVWGSPGWSPAAISAALEFWAEIYAGRDDLTFRWDPQHPPSPMAQRAIATLDAVRAGEVDTYTIGELEGGWKLNVTGDVMDQLLDAFLDEDDHDDPA